MTQNDLIFLREAIGVKGEALLTEIVNNHNTIAAQKEKEEEKKAKKGENK